MIKKIKIVTFVLLVTILNIQCQNMKKDKNIDLSKAVIKIDSCGLYYKGHHLDLGTPVSEWEKVLGKAERVTKLALVWDKLGIAIDDWQNEGERGKVAAVYVFFINLDSQEGQEGQLNYARDFESSNHVAARNVENGVSLISDERKKEIDAENKEQIKSYIYPFTIYNGYVNLHGFPIGAGMKIAEINSYRKNLPFSGEFGYVDQDIDGVNDSGNTTDTFGGDYRAPGEECIDNRLQYYELTYTASGALEYLKIGYESLGDSKNRKERDKDRKEREKSINN